jgi:RimJ/RimL family protein N-acetyltransferase
MELRAKQVVGSAVQLELIDERHREELRLAADHDRIWEHTVTVVRGEGYDPYFAAALTARDGDREVPFVVRLRQSGRVVGSTRFLDPVERHRRVEIGATWYSPDTWGTVVNAECKLLLLRHAFEAWGANRVALLTDILNVRSQAAIRKLGAREEGVLRAHMVVKNGRIRDSVLFSITRPEWPTVRTNLEERVRSAAVPG